MEARVKISEIILSLSVKEAQDLIEIAKVAKRKQEGKVVFTAKKIETNLENILALIPSDKSLLGE